jgi:hypothetical protein
MSMNNRALACAITAAVVAAFAVTEQRIGLGLAVMVVVMVAAGLVQARRGGRRREQVAFAAIAIALAVQPAVLDAGWVVAIDLAGALVGGATAVVAPGRWADVRTGLAAPFRLVGGSLFLVGALARLPRLPVRGRVAPLARGTVLAAVLVAVFGALFAAADSAFADVLDGVPDVQLGPLHLFARGALALLALTGAGALALAAARPVAPTVAQAPRWRPTRAELLLPLGAVVALFAAFVGVQLRVLFGGASYVQHTTGLGYGEYARHGFTELVAVASLTLVVVAVAAARSRDRAVRALLAALCVLTLVVLASAHHRLDLVEDAYGATRVRYAGHAVVWWLTGVFALVLVAGSGPRAARHLPRAVAAFTLAGLLAFSLSDPDRQIARTAVARAEHGKAIDAGYLAGLSADALPALERLKGADGYRATEPIRERLARPDGLAGWNLSRARAR